MNWREHRLVIGVVAAIVFAIASGDFSNRIFVGRDHSVRAFVVPRVVLIAPAPERALVLAELVKWVGQDVSEQAKPREIVLQGVFFSGTTPRAVLSLVAQDGRKPERSKVTVGDVVEGWKVESINPMRIIISRDSESRELMLFKRR